MKNKDRFEIVLDCVDQLSSLFKTLFNISCNLKENFKPKNCKDCVNIRICLQLDMIRQNLQDLRKDLKLDDPNTFKEDDFEINIKEIENGK
ncbi:MAG: hypothetical protein QXG00_06105 [Candidatus Woesearchaeota archaeon]